MCRLLGYLGPRLELRGLVYDAPFGLERQAWSPRRQLHGTVNADGWGAGWYDRTVRPEPARYRSTLPIWADRTFADMAPLLFSDCVVAAVRDATPGLPVDLSSTPPFAEGRWLFAHNGVLDGFRDGAGTTLRRSLSPARESAIIGGADSEVAFAVLLDELDRHRARSTQAETEADDAAGGGELAAAMRGTVHRIRSVTGGRLNFLAADGERLVATRAGDTLFVWSGDTPAGTLTMIASEPVDDDDDWIEVPDEVVVIAERNRVPRLEPL